MKNLQEDIKTGNFRRVYLLCGDEAYLKIQYKDKLIKALNPDDDTMNFSKYEGKGIEVREMIDLCETMPFFANSTIRPSALTALYIRLRLSTSSSTKTIRT